MKPRDQAIKLLNKNGYLFDRHGKNMTCFGIRNCMQKFLSNVMISMKMTCDTLKRK